MPWDPADSRRHTKKASSAVDSRQWAAIANDVLSRTDDDAQAIRTANGVLKNKGGRKRLGGPSYKLGGAANSKRVGKTGPKSGGSKSAF